MSIIVLGLHEHPIPPAVEAAWLAQLPAPRRQQLNAWPDGAARRRSLLGSRLLREGLRRQGYPPQALSGLRYPAHGRPTLDLPLAFSLSHCEGQILCAISTAGAIGVDIERLAPLGATDLRIYLTARERAWAGDDPLRLYTLWTRKEAVAKASGTLGLRRLPDIEAIEDLVDLDGTRWFTAPLDPGPGYLAHLAGAGARPSTQIERVAFEMLL